MYLRTLQLKNLRCFSEKELEFSKEITLIEGQNGSGKTTIIEALYYLCYLRSFRTNITQELIRFNSDSFFIKAFLTESDETLQVGFSPAKRLVKLNDHQISSFKELINNYRIIVLTEDDLDIIKGGPEIRRSFIDQYIYLQDLEWLSKTRVYKRILDNRNALLRTKKFDQEHYKVWTDQLMVHSQIIRQGRILAIAELESAINKRLDQVFEEDLTIKLIYQARNWRDDFLLKEPLMERTLFGAHLDDYQIQLASKASRKYASRGQQKLVAILMKIVQVDLLKKSFQGAILFLLDDFVTDLDERKTLLLMDILTRLQVQLVFTAPNMQTNHKDFLIKRGAKIIKI